MLRIAAPVLCCAIQASGQTDVMIHHFQFTPADITIPVGSAVRWTNHEAIEHTATSQTGPGTLISSGLFDSGLLALGESYVFTFTQPGVYHYFCVPHGSSMQGVVRVTASCYANCDASAGIPVLTANDFQCFLNRFASGDGYANCDGSTGSPQLTANDFQCFLNAFAAGCT